MSLPFAATSGHLHSLFTTPSSIFKANNGWASPFRASHFSCCFFCPPISHFIQEKVSAFKDSWDYTGLTLIIRDNLPISRSHNINLSSKIPFSMKGDILAVSRDLSVHIFGGPLFCPPHGACTAGDYWLYELTLCPIISPSNTVTYFKRITLYMTRRRKEQG